MSSFTCSSHVSWQTLAEDLACPRTGHRDAGWPRLQGAPSSGSTGGRHAVKWLRRAMALPLGGPGHASWGGGPGSWWRSWVWGGGR